MVVPSSSTNLTRKFAQPRSDSTASRFKPTLDPFSTFPSPSPSRSTIETSSPLPMTPSPTAAASGSQLPHWCHSVQYWRGCKAGLMESTIVTATRAMKGVKRANDVVEFEEVRVQRRKVEDRRGKRKKKLTHFVKNFNH